MNVKNEMGLADDPNDLIEGMAHFLQQVGVGSSYLDLENPQHALTEKWVIILRGLLNPYSLEGKFWRDNLVKIKAEWEKKKQM